MKTENKLTIALLAAMITALLTPGTISGAQIQEVELTVANRRYNSYSDGIYKKDAIFLDKGCVIDLSEWEIFPVIILDIDNKEGTVIENQTGILTYKITRSSNYMVFAAQNGDFICINDSLTIDYPCENRPIMKLQQAFKVFQTPVADK